MNDQNKAELRRLAEAQPIKEWTREEGELPVMKSSVLMFGVRGPECVSDFEGWGFTRAAASYISAADPAAVLSLLDENAQLIDEVSIYRNYYKAERDKLRAEVEALRKDAGRLEFVCKRDGDFHFKQAAAGSGWMVMHCADGMALVGSEFADFREAVDFAMAKEGSANG